MGNPIRAGRPVDNPWARLEHSRNDWEWRILKAYKAGKTSKEDEYARFYCAVMSPHTFGSWEYGDVYVTEVLKTPGIEFIEMEPEFEEWLQEYIAGRKFLK